MAQIKKKQIRQAIIDSAHDLFSDRGYHATTLQEISDLAGVGVSNVYSYFPSKLHLLYTVLEPWHREAFNRIEQRVAKQETQRDRLRAILLGVWRDMATENVGLVNSLMEALSMADPKQKKPSALLRWTEKRLAEMMSKALPNNTIDYSVLPNLVMMAFDGFVINRRLNDIRDIERTVDVMCDMIFASENRTRLAAISGNGEAAR